MAQQIEATLAERGTRYGEYPEHARITQNIKRAMQDSPNWDGLPDDMREALEMIAHKVGRILNGDPSYHDSWHDIIGYTKLVADRLLSVPSAPTLPPMPRPHAAVIAHNEGHTADGAGLIPHSLAMEAMRDGAVPPDDDEGEPIPGFRCANGACAGD